MEFQLYKAQRRTIQIGDIPLEVAMLPNGGYVFSQSEVAQVVEKSEIYIRRFLQSKRVKALPGLHSKFDTLPIEGSKKPIAPVSPELAALYWHKCAAEGNTKAQALVIALIKRSVYDLADEAFGVNRTLQERDRELAEDLSDQGVARIEAMQQSLNHQMFSPQPETQTERELKLKIRLAEIELELEQQRHALDSDSFPAKDIDKIGVAPWKVIPWTQKALGWSDANETFQLLQELGYGFDSKHWFRVRVTGDLWVLPWATFDALTKAVKQFNSEQN